MTGDTSLYVRLDKVERDALLSHDSSRDMHIDLGRDTVGRRRRRFELEWNVYPRKAAECTRAARDIGPGGAPLVVAVVAM